MSQQDDSQNLNKYAIKYGANEIFLVDGKCLNPEKCVCTNEYPPELRCFMSLDESKASIENYYCEMYYNVKDMTEEQFKKEFLRK